MAKKDESTMDIKTLKQLVAMVEEANVSHFSVESNGLKVEIKKQQEGIPVQATQVTLPPAAPVQAAPTPAPAMETVAEPAKDVSLKEDKNVVAVQAQMVGTFYEAPNPDSPAFVKVGDKISTGQVVCIIEAMKLFNEIESDVAGTVEQICVKNGDSVEYGQDIFLVRI